MPYARDDIIKKVGLENMDVAISNWFLCSGAELKIIMRVLDSPSVKYIASAQTDTWMHQKMATLGVDFKRNSSGHIFRKFLTVGVLY
jgi:hypothetical protein